MFPRVQPMDLPSLPRDVTRQIWALRLQDDERNDRRRRFESNRHYMEGKLPGILRSMTAWCGPNVKVVLRLPAHKQKLVMTRYDETDHIETKFDHERLVWQLAGCRAKFRLCGKIVRLDATNVHRAPLIFQRILPPRLLQAQQAIQEYLDDQNV